jgi:diguanylate cyclase (GGDEF)-like protein/PAS domain S-box-containing protein
MTIAPGAVRDEGSARLGGEPAAGVRQGWAGNRIAWRPIIMLGALLALLAPLALLAMGLIATERDRERLASKSYAQQLGAGVASEFARRLSALDSALLGMTGRVDALLAIRARDGQLLAEAVSPLHRSLRAEQGVTHLDFYDTDQTVVLAMRPLHGTPAKAPGDRAAGSAGPAEIAPRPTVSIELGPDDRPVLRSKRAFYLGGRMIGYGEAGMPVADILESLKEQMRADFVLLLSKPRIDRAQWERLRAGEGLAAAWDDHPDQVVVASTLAAPQPALSSALARAGPYAGPIRTGADLLLVPLPLEKLRAGLDGTLLVIGDVSQLSAASQRTKRLAIWLFALTTALIIAGTLLLLRQARHEAAERQRIAAANRGLEREIQQRRRAELRLQSAQEELEQRVEARTRELVEANATLRDEVAERQIAEQLVREAEQRLERALRAADVALFDLDIGTGALHLTPQWAAIVGGEPRAVNTTFNEFLDRVHPADRAAVDAAFETVAGGAGSDYEVEHRILHADGGWRWIRSKGQVVARDAHGRAQRVAGTHVDTTRTRRYVEALSRSEARFRSLTSLSSHWYWEQDEELRFVEVSGGVAVSAGMPVEAYLGRRRWEVQGLDMPESFWAEHRATLEARRPFADLELRAVGADGVRRYISVSGEPVFDEQGRFRGYRGTSRNITGKCETEARVAMQFEITALLAEAGPVRPTLERAMRIVCERLEWHCAARRVLDPAQGLLLCEESVDDGSDSLREFIRTAARHAGGAAAKPTGPVGRAWFERSAVWIEDIEAAAGFRRAPLALAAGLRSAVAFPILARGEPVGVFEFYSRLRQPEIEATRSALQSIGCQIGQYLERKRAESAVHLAGKAFETAAESIVITDRRGWIVDVNPAFTRVTGFERDEVLGRSPRLLRAEGERPGRLREIAAALRREGSWQGEVWSRRRNGEVYPEWMSVVAVRDDSGARTNYVALSVDISERKAAEERLRQLANFDVLTQLPNRAMVNHHLDHALAQAARNGRSLAVLFIDLDRFKFVNDTIGHEAGDRVLVETARRLRSCLRASDLVGRIGGDEFVAVLEETADAAALGAVAAKILSALSEPYRLDAQEFHLSASVGIANYPEDAGDRAGLLRCADLAMYRAKELGKNNYQFYSAQLNAQSVERMMLESALRHALERGEFDLAWQARVGIGDGRITGVEALLRWRHPELGMVPPGQFVPLAEETGLIVPIGDWAIEAACRQARLWLDAGLPPVRVAVNLSARQFEHETLVQTVGRLLDDYRLPPGTLELEITESLVMHNPEQAVRLLDTLRQIGIYLSIDDFGTGYSSLAQLKRFPVDSLKIDRSFVQGLPDDSDDAAITSAVVAMAHSLRLRTVAEGVETAAQLDYLRELGCDEMQGYLYSRPIPAEEFARLLAAGTDRTAAARAA